MYQSQAKYQNLANNQRQTKQGIIARLTKILGIFFGIQALLLAMLGTSFLMLVEKNEDQADIEGVIQYISKNINTSPISNMTLTTGFCDKDFEPLHIFHYRGTQEGCLCGQQVKKKGCSKSCQTISETYKQELFQWREIAICIQRIKQEDYIQTDKECGPGYIQCNVNFCVKEGQNCPITKIQISNEKDPSFYTFRAQTSHEIKMQEGYSLFFWREKGQPGIYTLQVSIDNEPCLNEQHDPPLFSTNQKYPLMKTDYSCGKYGQDVQRSSDIDLRPFITFLEDNKMHRQLTSLPEFEEYSQDKKAILFQRLQIYYKKDMNGCGEFDHNKILKIDDYSDNLINTGWVYIFFKFCFFVALFMVIMIDCCKNRGKVQKINPGVSNGIQFLNFALLIVIIIEGMGVEYYYDKKDEVEEYYQKFGVNNCFYDENMNEKFKNIDSLFTESMEDYDSVAYLCFIWASIIFFALITLSCCGLVKKCQEKRNKRKQKKYQPETDQPYQKLDNPYSNFGKSQIKQLKGTKKLAKNIQMSNLQQQQGNNQILGINIPQQQNNNNTIINPNVPYQPQQLYQNNLQQQQQQQQQQQFQIISGSDQLSSQQQQIESEKQKSVGRSVSSQNSSKNKKQQQQQQQNNNDNQDDIPIFKD